MNKKEIIPKKELKRNNYGKTIKKKMRKMENNPEINTFITNEKIQEINNDHLTLQIKELNNDIQKKIYFITMRNYWKKTTLETIYRPFWYSYKEHMDKEKSKVYFQNIHFMHLESNTLPENKKWIMGCQCSFCKGYSKKNKNNIPIYITEKDFIRNNLKLSEYHSFNINYWNTYTINYFKIYDYLYDVVDSDGNIDVSLLT